MSDAKKPSRTASFSVGPFPGPSSSHTPGKADVVTLAHKTGTWSVLLGALKAAYGWTDSTRLHEEEFLRLRDNWLQRSAKEG